MKTTIKYLLILISISANAQLEQKTTDYSYDNLNRLVQVVFNDNSTHNYVYDDIGNRTQLNIETLSIDTETLTNTITVYPNPTDSFLNIKLPDSFTSKSTYIQIYDVNGRLIVDNKPTIIDNQITINVNSLSNGVYLIHLITDSQKWSKLFIKK
jgi:YD repeat-containing protein|tara:strand:- start:64 stop:525 length:462 start_codon:yes stop_codon:yes gene_type:complete